MIKNNKGFTLIEMIMTISMIGILSLMIFPINKSFYDKILLETTANKINSAFLLAQQLSLDQSKRYCVESYGDSICVREDSVDGKVVFTEKIDKKLKIIPSYYYKITYTRNGLTDYKRLIIVNRLNEKIQIETKIGTGRVKMSRIH